MAKRIMIVDDNKAYALLIQHKLHNSGYETEMVHHGSHVLRMAMNGSWDLILLDYKMPDVMGSRVCSNLRSEKKLDHLPIIMVTAHHELSEDMFRSYGATDVIYKPFQDKELLEKIEKCLAKPA